MSTKGRRTGFSLHPNKAVSYTHLDVYKRQVHDFTVTLYCFTVRRTKAFVQGQSLPACIFQSSLVDRIVTVEIQRTNWSKYSSRTRYKDIRKLTYCSHNKYNTLQPIIQGKTKENRFSEGVYILGGERETILWENIS